MAAAVTAPAATAEPELEPAGDDVDGEVGGVGAVPAGDAAALPAPDGPPDAEGLDVQEASAPAARTARIAVRPAADLVTCVSNGGSCVSARQPRWSVRPGHLLSRRS